MGILGGLPDHDSKNNQRPAHRYPVPEAMPSNCIGIVRRSPDGGFIVRSQRGVDFPVDGAIAWTTTGPIPLTEGCKVMFTYIRLKGEQTAKARSLGIVTCNC